MTASEEITFEPSLAHVFAQDFHHATVFREIYVGFEDRLHKNFIGHFIQGIQAIRGCLIRADHTEIFRIRVQTHHFAKQLSQGASGFKRLGSRLVDLESKIAKIRHGQIAQQQTAIGMKIRTHATVAGGSQFRKLGPKFAIFIEKLLRFVTFHPVFQHFYVGGKFFEVGERHLMGSPGIFDRFSFDHFWPGPTLRCT